MRLRIVTVVLAMVLAACGGGGSDDQNTGSDLDGGFTGFSGSVDRAQTVGDASNQRLDDLQNQLNTP